MVKVVINSCFGGFSLSTTALIEMGKLGNELALEEIKEFRSEEVANDEILLKLYDRNYLYGIERDNPDLVKVVEVLGDRANGCSAELKVVEIPDNMEWEIKEHDGDEHVAEKHRKWS